MSLKARMSVWLRLDFSIPRSKEPHCGFHNLGTDWVVLNHLDHKCGSLQFNLHELLGTLLSCPLTGLERFHLSWMHRMNRPTCKLSNVGGCLLMLNRGQDQETTHGLKKLKVEKFSRRRQESHARPSVSREGEKSPAAGWAFLLIICLGAVGERRRGN